MSFFTVVEPGLPLPSQAGACAYLVPQSWDDWSKYATLFKLYIFDSQGKLKHPGTLKIASQGLKPSPNVHLGHRSPQLPAKFEALDDHYFSLGQEETYYETLNTLPEEIRLKVLIGLLDCAYDINRFNALQHEEAMYESLLRFVQPAAVRTRFHRLARGDASLTPFDFTFFLPAGREGVPALQLAFKVSPNSHPPTNVHVLIGRNGVGKSRCMRSMAQALIGTRQDKESSGNFFHVPRQIDSSARGPQQPLGFAGLVFVSFSAFDRFVLPISKDTKIRSASVGLTQASGPEEFATKSHSELTADFLESLQACRHGLRSQRLRAAIATLGNDPLFGDASIETLLEAADEQWRERAEYLFGHLSSGHAIVLLTITRLVEHVDERTLVLIDEPEGHLHPPLLSAFIRSLTDLLVTRNGVAIIATHSPVVLQEVPKSCVWKFQRQGAVSSVDRPNIETFGENVGVLTRAIFGLEVTNAGFHKMIADAISIDQLTYEELLERFDGQLGAEGRMIAKALIFDRDNS